MRIIEIFGNGCEPSLFIIAGRIGEEEIYTFNKEIGWTGKRNDMDMEKFEKHCDQMRKEGYSVHEVTDTFQSDILK